LLVGKEIVGLLERKEINRYREIIKVLVSENNQYIKEARVPLLFTHTLRGKIKIKKSLVFIGF
jgi:hypothetical protein